MHWGLEVAPDSDLLGLRFVELAAGAWGPDRGHSEMDKEEDKRETWTRWGSQELCDPENTSPECPESHRKPSRGYSGKGLTLEIGPTVALKYWPITKGATVEVKTRRRKDRGNRRYIY